MVLDFCDQFLVLERPNKIIGEVGKIWLVRKDQMNSGCLVCTEEAGVQKWDQREVTAERKRSWSLPCVRSHGLALLLGRWELPGPSQAGKILSILQLCVLQFSTRTASKKILQPNKPYGNSMGGFGWAGWEKTAFHLQGSLMALQPLEDELCLITSVTSWKVLQGFLMQLLGSISRHQCHWGNETKATSPAAPGKDPVCAPQLLCLAEGLGAEMLLNSPELCSSFSNRSSDSGQLPNKNHTCINLSKDLATAFLICHEYGADAETGDGKSKWTFAICQKYLCSWINCYTRVPMEIGPCCDVLVPNFNSDYRISALSNHLRQWSHIFSRQQDQFPAWKAGSLHCRGIQQPQNEAPSAAETSVHRNWHPAVIQVAKASEMLR